MSTVDKLIAAAAVAVFAYYLGAPALRVAAAVFNAA